MITFLQTYKCRLPSKCYSLTSRGQFLLICINVITTYQLLIYLHVCLQVSYNDNRHAYIDVVSIDTIYQLLEIYVNIVSTMICRIFHLLHTPVLAVLCTGKVILTITYHLFTIINMIHLSTNGTFELEVIWV